MNPKILILDDQVQYLRSLERALRGDFEVVAASKRVEAEARLSSDIRIVLTDVRLDESDDEDRQGLDFIRFVRGVDPNVPIIAMSALDTTDIESAVLSAGGTRFLRKPIVVSELRRLLSELSGKGP